ncbi:hypothetical protein AAT19DRAFT_8834 [Rhodotorula toruloides]|uniref:Uncharacterized protein n=1 Tax=Rhodotorula toruloides TaxID=5286 RepID=A0A2T0AID3_RHOTO|nr:hypothetical protein AAT19DRAFT_8834 [Rhodotorula toruloides]
MGARAMETVGLGLPRTAVPLLRSLATFGPTSLPFSLVFRATCSFSSHCRTGVQRSSTSQHRQDPGVPQHRLRARRITDHSCSLRKSSGVDLFSLALLLFCSLKPSHARQYLRIARLSSPSIIMPRRGVSLRSDIAAIGVKIRVLATGQRHSGRCLTEIDKEFTRVFKTEMLQFAGEYARRFLQNRQKHAILHELRAAEAEARQLRAARWTAEQILQELEVRCSLQNAISWLSSCRFLRLQVNYTAEAIRQRLNLPPFLTHSPDDQTFAAEYPAAEEPLAYERTGLTPAPTDGVDPRYLYSGGGQHSLAKQQGERDEVPGYGESWTARKAAIYGRSF